MMTTVTLDQYLKHQVPDARNAKFMLHTRRTSCSSAHPPLLEDYTKEEQRRCVGLCSPRAEAPGSH